MAFAQTASNVICNKCVGASDLGKFAATRAKIAKKAVTTNRIAPGAVKTSRIGNSQVSTAKLAPGAVTASRIAAGAVTAAGIATGAVGTTHIGNGQVTTGKIGAGAVTAAELAEDAVFMRTIVVRAVGPAATDNCDELQAALAGISDASAANPYVVHLEPGDYDCGTDPVVMKSFVDLAGSGRDITHVRGEVAGSDGLVRMAAHTEIRDLSVTNDLAGTGTIATGIGDLDAASPVSILNVSSTGSGAINGNNGVVFDDTNCGSNCQRTLVNVLATGDGGFGATGIGSTNPSDLNITDTVAQAINAGSNFGLVAQTGTVFAQGSRFIGASFTVVANSGSAVEIVHSQLDGGAILTNTGGTITCFGTYNENFTAEAC